MSIERQQSFVNKPNDPTEAQITVTCRYKKLPNGTEILTWNYRLGSGELVFIANLPRELLPEEDVLRLEKLEEDKGMTPRARDMAPVYVHWKIRRPGPDDRRALINNPGDPTERQITVTGHLRPGKGDDGHETFVVVLRAGLFELVFIVNIPQILYDEEDRYESDKPLDEAPVYVKTKLADARDDDREDERPARVVEPTRTGHRAKEPPVSREDKRAH